MSSLSLVSGKKGKTDSAIQKKCKIQMWAIHVKNFLEPTDKKVKRNKWNSF